MFSASNGAWNYHSSFVSRELNYPVSLFCCFSPLQKKKKKENRTRVLNDWDGRSMVYDCANETRSQQHLGPLFFLRCTNPKKKKKSTKGHRTWKCRSNHFLEKHRHDGPSSKCRRPLCSLSIKRKRPKNKIAQFPPHTFMESFNIALGLKRKISPPILFTSRSDLTTTCHTTTAGFGRCRKKPKTTTTNNRGRAYLSVPVTNACRPSASWTRLIKLDERLVLFFLKTKSDDDLLSLSPDGQENGISDGPGVIMLYKLTKNKRGERREANYSYYVSYYEPGRRLRSSWMLLLLLLL